MKQAKWFVSLFLLVVLVSVNGQAKAEMISGNMLVEKMRDYEKIQQGERDEKLIGGMFYIGFVTGVVDALHWMPPFSFELPDGATTGQLADVVAKYLKEHPEKRTEPGAWLVIQAVMTAFPQKKK